MKSLAGVAFALMLLLSLPLQALDTESQIKAMLNVQVEAWNRGDLPTFVTTYAPDCIFVGKQITQGSTQLLAHYQKAYPTPAAMGHLAFKGLTVHLLSPDIAIVTSEWRLERSASAGGPTGGLFSLVLRRYNGVWKIALDHTS